MATRTLKGGAPTIQQVDLLVAGGTITAGDLFDVTLTDETGTSATLAVAATGTTVTQTHTDIAAAIEASTDPRFTAVTAAASASNVALTAIKPGVPFYCTVAAGSPSDGHTFTRSAFTANSGPSDLNSQGNYAEGDVPVAGDNTIVTGGGNYIYGMNQTATFTGAFTVAAGSTAVIGSAGARLRMTPSSYLHSGTGLAYIDLNTAAITARITKTAIAINGQPGLDIIGSALSTLRVEGGSVGSAIKSGESATITTIELVGGSCIAGTGLTLTTWSQLGGNGEIDCAATNITADDGKLLIAGTGAVTNLTNNGAAIVSNTSGTISNFTNVDGTTDFTQSRTARTITTPTIKGGTVILDSNVITLTNKIAPSGRLSIKATPL